MTEVTISDRWLVRGGTAANLTTVNEIPKARELVFETDTFDFKLGDGATAWTSLGYYAGSSHITKLGTIATGTWQGTAIAATKGGTGQTTYAVGDMLYCSATDVLSKIAAGTNGHVLTLVSGIPAWTVASGGGGSGAMSYVNPATVSGSAATVLTLSSLDLDADQVYLVVFRLENANASASTIRLFYNADTTTSNYFSQFVGGSAGAYGGYENSGRVAILDANETCTGHIWIYKDRDGKTRANAVCSRGPASSALIKFDTTHVWNNTANITGITFSGTTANSLAVGSTFKVFKVVG